MTSLRGFAQPLLTAARPVPPTLADVQPPHSCSRRLPQIFHELNGPIFPPRHLRRSFMVQDILDRIEAKRRQGLGPAEGLAEG